MSIVKTAEFTVRPEAVDEGKAAIAAFVAAVAAGEEGTQLYSSFQQADEPTRFLHVMVFDYEEAEARHRGSEWVKRFTDALYPLTEQPPTFTDYVGVAST